MAEGTKFGTKPQVASIYIEGVLETEDCSDGDGNERVVLTGYDGCFELPEYIIEALEKKGVIIDL